MTKLLQTIMDGLAIGSVYALIALGYTLVYGILKFINFAHGSIFMLGAWFSYLIGRRLLDGVTGPPPPHAAAITLLGAMALCALAGLLIEFLAYRPLRRAPRLNVLITAIGVSLLIENIGQLPWAFGTNPVSMPALLPERTLATFAGVNLRLVDVLILIMTVGLMLGLELLIFRTRLGRAMRAVAHNHQTASLMGINVNAVIALTFVIGSALAGAAGFFNALKYPSLQQPAHYQWLLLGIKSFVAAVVGGIGNVHGAVLGGVLIGFVEMFGAAYLSPHLRDVYVFSLLIIVLLLRPAGLLGRADVEKL